MEKLIVSISVLAVLVILVVSMRRHSSNQVKSEKRVHFASGSNIPKKFAFAMHDDRHTGTHQDMSGPHPV